MIEEVHKNATLEEVITALEEGKAARSGLFLWPMYSGMMDYLWCLLVLHGFLCSWKSFGGYCIPCLCQNRFGRIDGWILSPSCPNQKDLKWFFCGSWPSVQTVILFHSSVFFNACLLAEVFTKETVLLHGIPSSIVSDRDFIFVSNFWCELFKFQGT